MGRRPMMPVNSTSGVHKGLKEGCWAQFQGQYFTCRHETCGQDLPGDYRGPDLRMVIPFAEAPVEWWYRTLPEQSQVPWRSDWPNDRMEADRGYGRREDWQGAPYIWSGGGCGNHGHVHESRADFTVQPFRCPCLNSLFEHPLKLPVSLSKTLQDRNQECITDGMFFLLPRLPDAQIPR